ncbi:MAG: hypothetical protein KA325_06510, partial [Flavobacterium sp.]|nr:hypothetical protein [Flavobacterium sp.]MBP6557445.1 hypothetical protein [Flavobacterium sp.]
RVICETFLSFSFKNGQSYKLFSICCTSVEVCTVAVRIADNVLLPDVVADLATEFSPLAQNENSKKERTIYRKTAIAFDSG